MAQNAATTNHAVQIPQTWIEECCKRRRPDLYQTRHVVTEVALSYARKVGSQLEEDKIALQDVEEDLSAGFALVRYTNDKEQKYFYGLHGARFVAYVNSDTARENKWPLAIVTSVKRKEQRRLQDHTIGLAVTFRELSREVQCDIESLFDDLSIGLQRKAEESRVAHQLLSHRRNVSAETQKRLHDEVRRQYGTLRSVMSLLQMRADNEATAEATGIIVLPRQETASDAGQRQETVVDDSPEFTDIRLESCSGTFQVDCLVEISKEDESGRRKNRRNASARVRVRGQDGDTLQVDSQDRIVLTPGDKVHIRRIARFSMWAHSKSLDHMLAERTEGRWSDFARLLCEPGVLQPLAQQEPAHYFCDTDRDGGAYQNVVLTRQQRDAVTGALSTPHVYFIQGPPGTGKTTVISELVRQLTHKGERVLLLAPTNVAVDEVLRRIGEKRGLFPVRLSWDDARVHPEVRRYVLTNVERELAAKIRRPTGSRAGEWRKREEMLTAAHSELTRVIGIQESFAEAGREVERCKAEHSEQKQSVQDEHDRLAAAIQKCAGLEQELLLTRQSEVDHLKHYEGEIAAARSSMGAIRRFFSSAFGRLSQLSSNLRTYQRRLRETEASIKRRASERQELEHRLNAALDDAGRRARELEDAIRQAEENKRDLEKEWRRCRRRARESWNITASEFRAREEEWSFRLARLRDYAKYEKRWFALNRMADNESVNDELVAQIGADLLQSVNLVCCTTTGIASVEFIRGVSFDTMIVDEASRVTDSEFMIGGIRSRRWVMIGDEHQLPPYVDQADEYFLHALAALHRAENQRGGDLRAAVEDLADIWEVDEDLHRFRIEPVVALAEEMRTKHLWEHTYRIPFQKAYRHAVKSDPDPEKELLRTMRDYLVRSLFERNVNAIVPSLKTKLTVQRRMLKPIADLVNIPIYSGDFDTADDEELCERGVVPITTPTFRHAVTFLDTSARGAQAKERLVGHGFVNRLERDWVVGLCRNIERELPEQDSPISVSILSFYRAQCVEIGCSLGWPYYRNFRKLKFEVVDAIDKIQGQESDIVILSFCRTKTHGTPGPRYAQWLQDLRRLNVAFTRARRALILVGHSETLRKLCYSPEARGFYAHLFDCLKHDASMTVISDYRSG